LCPELEAEPHEAQVPADEQVAELREIRRVLEDIRARVQVLTALVALLMIGLLIGAILAASFAGRINDQLGL
jgi:hypothetical protein